MSKPPYSIRTDFLSEEEAARVYDRHPEMSSDPQEWCPTCGTTGTYRWQGKEHQCDCVLQLQLFKHYCASGIDLDYQRLGWDDLEVQTNGATDAFVEYTQNLDKYASQGFGVLLFGPPGTGKTLVATLILKELIKKGYTGYSSRFSRMVEDFTAGWHDNAEKKFFARKYVGSQVLLLDDLGRISRSSSKLAESTFDYILSSRVNDGRPTLLTTNLTTAELESGYGAAVLSRLVEQSIAVETVGVNFRTKAHNRKWAEIKAGEKRPIC